jgi:hypothetical protein
MNTCRRQWRGTWKGWAVIEWLKDEYQYMAWGNKKCET